MSLSVLSDVFCGACTFLFCFQKHLRSLRDIHFLFSHHQLCLISPFWSKECCAFQSEKYPSIRNVCARGVWVASSSVSLMCECFWRWIYSCVCVCCIMFGYFILFTYNLDWVEYIHSIIQAYVMYMYTYIYLCCRIKVEMDVWVVLFHEVYAVKSINACVKRQILCVCLSAATHIRWAHKYHRHHHHHIIIIVAGILLACRKVVMWSMRKVPIYVL